MKDKILEILGKNSHQNGYMDIDEQYNNAAEGVVELIKKDYVEKEFVPWCLRNYHVRTVGDYNSAVINNEDNSFSIDDIYQFWLLNIVEL